jgi:hypothetical protein
MTTIIVATIVWVLVGAGVACWVDDILDYPGAVSPHPLDWLSSFAITMIVFVWPLGLFFIFWKRLEGRK